jgi:NitT/TauT family transport system substrate-binding protein
VFVLPGNIAVQKALIEKRVEMAIDITGFWVERVMEGVPVTVIAEIDWSNGGDKIMLRKGVAPEALKGKLIGTYDNSAASLLFLHRFLKDHGLRLADVNRAVFETSDLPKRMRTTNMAAIICYDPYALEVEKDGTAVVGASTANYPGSIADSIAMRTDVVQAMPREDVVKFLKGWIQAAEWIKDNAHWPEYAKILSQKLYLGDPAMTDDVLRGILTGVKIHDAAILRQQHQPGSGIFLNLKELKAALTENQLLKKDFMPENLVDTSFLLEALGKP